MIKRFLKVTDGLYRGGAPSVNDVINLKKHFKINKIVSFDRHAGHKINDICNNLNIKHIMVPLDGSRKSLLGLFHHNIYDLLMNDGPTFIHCVEGKDRSGFIIALFKCLYMNYSYQDAIKEAKDLGFGIGAPPFIIKKFEQILKDICNKKDENNLNDNSIVSNERSYKDIDDGRGSYLDQATQGSFSPLLSKTRQYPYDDVYNTLYEQSPTRNNYKSVLNPYEEIVKEEIPLVGQYNNSGVSIGFGPVLNPGGFIYD